LRHQSPAAHGETMDTSRTVPLGLEPVSGATLFSLEVERRYDLSQRGTISTDCAEIDNAVLLNGGFERGCVVGISSEEVDFGLLVSLF
jgi:hypothetical protein